MNTIPQLSQLNKRKFSACAQPDHFTLAIHQEAENALSMALHHLRSGGGNLPSAKRKVAQALGALNRLEMLSLRLGEPAADRA
jgi:hypothetical protein